MMTKSPLWYKKRDYSKKWNDILSHNNAIKNNSQLRQKVNYEISHNPQLNHNYDIGLLSHSYEISQNDEILSQNWHTKLKLWHKKIVMPKVIIMRRKKHNYDILSYSYEIKSWNCDKKWNSKIQLWQSKLWDKAKKDYLYHNEMF